MMIVETIPQKLECFCINHCELELKAVFYNILPLRRKRILLRMLERDRIPFVLPLHGNYTWTSARTQVKEKQ
jgi:hypothetical protein